MGLVARLFTSSRRIMWARVSQSTCSWARTTLCWLSDGHPLHQGHFRNRSYLWLSFINQEKKQTPWNCWKTSTSTKPTACWNQTSLPSKWTLLSWSRSLTCSQSTSKRLRWPSPWPMCRVRCLSWLLRMTRCMALKMRCLQREDRPRLRLKRRRKESWQLLRCLHQRSKGTIQIGSWM